MSLEKSSQILRDVNSSLQESGSDVPFQVFPAIHLEKEADDLVLLEFNRSGV
jgi:hypothetical protein